ncbi:GntR family transcriptional regulator [Pisciglobus halotolerans]|uniref:DNA-binding transcriptional regulator, GntR family n=1 Tax=Pisciglobus halotolerans TaxID=745365 RepID=A0A1I3BPX2_9LACT|nr:GntR family transcriptional regulator [Pisciglobus halotolerans]SFH64126.1 DNA-binding transcriptional regulator, GntR family [Pisciglobus halotolerans]
MEDYINEIICFTDTSQFKPLNEIVYDGIRKAIITGRIPVGQRIKEKEFAERMNISRTPIRDALHRLEKEGLVEYIPKFGTVVKRITIEDAKEIYQIRQALDVVATVNAMNKMSKEQFDDLKQLLEKTEEANKNNQNFAEVIRLFSVFNETIYQLSEMPRLTSIVTKLREYLMRFRDISLTGEERRRKALDEHWMIYRGMYNKDAEQIKLIIQEHLSYSEKFILAEMEKQQNGN